ncbi:MAG TPA: transposase, partial [Geobacteraceae bacterium]|nr:transposase [Geobacteraceae bacterium]
MTEYTTGQLIFSFFQKRQLTVDFEGVEITSDAGLLLIRQADNSLHLTEGIAGRIEDRRDSRYADHRMVELLR